MKNVLLVLTVPAEYTQKERAIMRECALNAGLIRDISSKKLEFTTERKLQINPFLKKKINHVT